MATAGGPNIVRDGLVFGYDTNYGVADNVTGTRFYPGEPATNLYGDINTSAAIRPSRTEYNTDNWTAEFPKPPENIGRVYHHTSGALSSTWSGNSYGYTLKSYTYLANVTYTLSCWVYVSSDCNISGLPNSMEGTTLIDTSKRYYDLNNKGTWQQIVLKCKSASNVSGNVIPIYPRRGGITDGSFSGFYAFGGAKLEINDSVTPYALGTRSATASLIDLTKTTDIDVSNVSFDSTGQLDFDGTDDYVNMGDLAIIKLGTNFTIEAVVKPEQDKWMYFFHKGYGQNNSLAWGRHSTNDNWFFATMINGSYLYSYMGTATLNQYCHLVASYDGTNLRLYENGDLKATVATTHDMMTSTQPLGIGGPDRYWNGEIPVTKVYSKALVQSEVKQNYNAYKNRFNI